MIYPNFKEEKGLWQNGYKVVVGLDEAGRGPLAGPVVASAVAILKSKIKISAFAKASADKQNLKDSKKLSSKQRERFYKILISSPEIEWGIGKVSNKVIDKINILEATKLAMKKAIKSLERKLQKTHDRRNFVKFGKAEFLILDGNFRLDLDISQKSIVKADEKVFSCAAASILAKVTRDRIMIRYHQKYPRYRFDLHKGYPTKLHYKLLKKHGPCPIHRRSFNLEKKRRRAGLPHS